MPRAVVIEPSIAKVLAPMFFQNETPALEHVLEYVLTNMFSKCAGTQNAFKNTFQNMFGTRALLRGLNSYIIKEVSRNVRPKLNIYITPLKITLEYIIIGCL